MDVSEQVKDHIKLDSFGFITCTGKNYHKLLKTTPSLKLFGDIVNGMGILSAKSQNLHQVITSLVKFHGSDQRIYIKAEGRKALGFLRVGEKTLFYRDYYGSIKQIYPTCVLDIYVHQSCQRTGIGKEIFQKFLESEGKQPHQLAYDRPSPKLISFLKKHFNLSKHVPQNNNFVIFDLYFHPVVRSQKTIITKKTQAQKASKKNQKRISEPLDSLEILQKEVEKLKSLPANKDNQQKQEFRYQIPWGTKEERLLFRTTSNTYGSHYRII